MTVLRTAVPDFALGNPMYAGATITFYEIDEDGAQTTTLATIYEGPIGDDLLPNPFQLDGFGKNIAPLYLEVPVVAVVTSARFPQFTTGIIQVRGVWKGDWTTATRYNSGDIIADPDDGTTIYVAAADYVSGASLAADVTAGNLVVLIESTFGDFPVGTVVVAADYLPYEETSSGDGKKITITNFLTSAMRLMPAGSAAAPSIAAAADTDTGIAWNIGGANTASLVAGGAEAVRWNGVSSGVNFASITNAATGGNVTLAATGTDASVAWDVTTRGSGAINLSPGAVRQVQVSYTASAVNYSLLSGSATAGSLGIVATGTDSTIAFIVNAKSTGFVYLAGSSLPILRAASVASAVNYFDMTNAATGAGPRLSSTGSDTNIDRLVSSKGSGAHLFYSAAFGTLLFAITHVASAVNYAAWAGSATGTAVTLTATGADSNIGLTYVTKGSGVHTFTGAVGITGAFAVTGAISATTTITAGTGLTVTTGGITVTGASTITGTLGGLTGLTVASGGATISAGSLTVTGGTITTGSTTSLSLGTSGGEQVRIANVASAVNFHQFQGAVTTGQPAYQLAGSDTNVSGLFSSKGTGLLAFYSAAFGAKQFQIINTTSAVNYLELTGAATAGNTGVSAKGSDANSGLVVNAQGTGVVFLAANALPILKAQGVASSVNYVQVTPAATGSGSTVRSAGSDTNINLILMSQGTGAVGVVTNAGSQQQFNFSHTANAVNYLQATGAVTGSGPTLSAQGSDSTANPFFVAKGGTFLHFYSSSTTEQFRVAHAASAVNWLQVVGSATAVGTGILATGGDTNVSSWNGLKGGGAHLFYTNTFAQIQFAVTHTASAVNYVRATGNITVGNPRIGADGSDTNISFDYFLAGTGSHRFTTGGLGGPVQFQINHTASAVNGIQVQGGAAGNGTSFIITGSDSNVLNNYNTKGSEAHYFRTNAGSQLQFAITHTASAVNYLQATGHSTGANPNITAQGTDTNPGIIMATKGAGSYIFYTNAFAAPQLVVTHTGSAVNAGAFTGGATGNAPAFSISGTDTNVAIAYVAKGTGSHNFATDGTASTIQFQVYRTASAVNYLGATGAAAGSPPAITAIGSDTDIDILLTPKGAGRIRFGTFSAVVIAVCSGTTPIKMADGTTKYIMLSNAA